MIKEAILDLEKKIICKLLQENGIEFDKLIDKTFYLEENDLVLIVADQRKITKPALGALRNKLGHDLELIDTSKFNFLWVTEFPMYEYSEEEKRCKAVHHPFTMPNEEDIDKMETNPLDVRAIAYDIVLNGTELGGGSIRIHSREIQNRVFKSGGLGYDKKDVDAFHPVNVGKIMVGNFDFLPCTPAGVMELLKYYNVDISGVILL